jgi:hypothetical protein
MRIKAIRDQLRRDLYGTMECEGCGHEQKFVGYDDDNYHRNVVPAIKCESCGKSAADLGVEVRPLGTKYPAHQIV